MISPGCCARSTAACAWSKPDHPVKKEKGPGAGRRGLVLLRLMLGLRLAAVAEQLQQHHEQVDEVEIEPERAHHRLAAGDGAVVADASTSP